LPPESRSDELALLAAMSAQRARFMPAPRVAVDEPGQNVPGQDVPGPAAPA
jgi:hypothetical protein